ncbi:MAG TPA: biotin--[acetyl-CoA-carboxylase] ligase [Candidatus Limnocylindria bacterium]|nr:biotin--[acetyl-CoA-carboxylase] ligase [Candidatus Limnocylindria bacterium]
MLDSKRLGELLGSGVPLLYMETAASTNDAAKEWARRGAPHGATVAADAQTGGRGTRGRQFHSPPGGLYMSVVLDAGAALPGHLTTLAAVAAARAAREVTGLPVGIKWVNDLVLEGRKAGGILTESFEAGGRRMAVVGIGINTGPWDPPADLAGIACTLHRADRPVDRERIAALAACALLDGLARVPAHMADYRALCVTLGREVSFLYDGTPREGTAVAVDDDGALRVRAPGGELRLIAGDVGIRAHGSPPG